MKKVVLFFITLMFAFVVNAQEIGLNVGNIAPEISLPTPNGDTVKLSSLRGKMVLIDFWASWCGPCRKENPNVVKAYANYKDKQFIAGDGFTIYGVSLDKEADGWKSAIEKDKLTWTNVSDLRFWSSEAATLYGIRSIPSNVLIDGNGVIIAKNLRGEALEQTLEKNIFRPVKSFEDAFVKLKIQFFALKEIKQMQKYEKEIAKIEKELDAIQEQIETLKKKTDN
ncbi:MAG: redoxin domain-containing protein [Bacteroidales bacterium]|nr:redoxin domain-containing protein [Bacteroidales bacterium]